MADKRFVFHEFDTDREHTVMSVDGSGNERHEVFKMLGPDGGHELTISLSIAELRELANEAMKRCEALRKAGAF